MGLHVTESWNHRGVAFTDPDALVLCDNPGCDAPWVTADALVSWVLMDMLPSRTMFTDRFVVGCNAACLRAAQAQHPRREWSDPAPVGQWLDALRASLSVDPRTTPIGEFASSTAV